MKPKTSRRLLLLAAALAAPLAAQAQQIISLSIANNFNGNTYNTMTSTDYAGVGAYRVNTWNNLNKNGGGTNNYSGSNILFSGGATVGGSFSVSITMPTANGGVADLTNDAKFYRGFVELQGNSSSTTTGSITLSNIPFEHYEIIVYVDGGHVSRGGSVTLAATGSQAAETFYVRGNRISSNDGTGYSLATSTTYESGVASSVVASNYVVFDGLNASSQTIDFTPLNLGDGNYRLNVVGIQIVEVIPEPSSAAAFAGFACLVGVTLRRRRRAA